MKRYKVLLKVFALVSAVLFFGSSPGYGDDVPGVTSDIVKIGIVIDMSGPAAFYGQQATTATRTLFKHLNEQGGIHGRKLKAFIEDNQYDPVRTIAGAKYLVSRHNVFALVNVLGSTPIVALFPFIKEHKIPTLPGINECAQVFNPPKRYLFHATTPIYDQALFIVEYIIKDLKARDPKLAIIYQEDNWGKDGLKGFRKAAKYYGLNIVAEKSYKRRATDFSSQVVGLKRASPDYVYNAGVHAAGVLKEARKLGLQTQFIGDSGNLGKTIKLGGSAVRGFMLTYSRALATEDSVGVNRVKEISKRYKVGIKIAPEYLWGWLNCMVLVEGLRKSGRNLTREGYIDALETIKGYDPWGLTAPVTYGPISSGPKSRRGISGFRVLKADVDKGHFFPITGWREPSIE